MRQGGYSSNSQTQQSQPASGRSQPTSGGSQPTSSGSQPKSSGSQPASSPAQQPGGKAQLTNAIPQVPPKPGFRHVYLVSQCYPEGRSHWYIWIPSLAAPTIGRVIHVTGNPTAGWKVEFKDNQDLQKSHHQNMFVLLGQVPDTLIVDGYVPNSASRAIIRPPGTMRDDFDIAAWGLELPYIDLVNPPEPADDPIWHKPHPRFERCQEWTRRLIADLVGDGKLPKNAIQEMDKATSYTDKANTAYAYNRLAPAYRM